MDPIMMTVDVLGAITTLCSLAYERIDAAEFWLNEGASAADIVRQLGEPSTH